MNMMPAFKEFIVCGRDVAITGQSEIYINNCESPKDNVTAELGPSRHDV